MAFNIDEVLSKIGNGEKAALLSGWSLTRVDKSCDGLLHLATARLPSIKVETKG